MTEKEVAFTPPPSTPQKGGAVHVDRSPLPCSDADVLPKMSRSICTRERKLQFLKAFTKTAWNITKTAEAIGIDRNTVQNWMRKDKRFVSLMQEAQEERIDHIEDKMMSAIDHGDGTMIRYFLDRQAKHRGYVCKSTPEGSKDQLDELVKVLSQGPAEKNPEA